MADLFGGAAVGAVFGEALTAILEEANSASKFKSTFKRFESTTRAVDPLIKRIESINQKLEREEELKALTDKIKEAEELIRKCSKVRSFDFFRKAHYAKKLEKLDENITKLLQVNLQLQQARDQKETLLVLKDFSKQKNGGGFLCSAPLPPPLTVGLDLPLEELKMEIFGSEKSVIVVSAPAGCGKTTLVKKLCQDEEVKEKFGNQNIFFLTFSELPNIEVIVQRLFQHKNWEVPELVDENDAINQLGLLLQKIGECPILLVLDDVWDRSQSLLDEFVCQLPHNSKILVTSRSDFPKFGPPYNLKPLNHDDAMNLFSHSAILNDGNSYLPDKDTVEKIVKACNGFPLALKVVGGSLRGQPRAVWRSQALKLSKGTSVFDSSNILRNCLKSSIEALKDIDMNLKECYLDLGAFPEDQRIPASALIDIWTELYELDEDGIHAMANLHRLSLQNLLNLISLGNEEIEEDGFYNEHFVTQHDLLRELIILESSLEPVAERRRLIAYINGNKFPEWWLEQKQSTSACLMSISTDEAFSSRWHKIQLPHVEALVLNFQSKNYKLPVFIEKLDELKVLVVTNYGFFPTQICNFPLVGSLSNLKRIRLEKISVPSFSFNSLRLKNLQKICLVMCDTGEGFSEISDSFPNLVEIDIDYCNAMKEFPDGFCDLIQLKKLSITNCHKISTLPGRIGNLMNLETLRLSSCIDLSELPDTIGRLRNLRHLNISDCVSIGKLPTQIGEMCSLRRLFMNNCTNCELPLSIGKLEHLEVLCDEETALQWANLEAYFKNLKITVIQEDTNLNWLPLNSHHF